MNDPSAELGFAKALKPTSSGSQKVFEMKFAKLNQLEKALDNLETQKELLQSKGISEEPIILFKTKNGKYELVEGWHRIIQLFILYPNEVNKSVHDSIKKL